MSPNELNRRELIAGMLSIRQLAAARILAAEDSPADFSNNDSEATVAPQHQADVLLSINGKSYAIQQMDVHTTLLDCLRDHLSLTGTKKGCGLGHCGACTVLVDGRRVTSCLTLAVMQQGREITTIEGLAGDSLHPVQSAFIEHDGYQCGYCTPGQIMSAVACIQEGHTQTDDEIREWMSGNICRCGAYPNIVAAVRAAAGAHS